MQFRTTAIFFLLVCLTMVPVLWASGLLERDARRLERAKEHYAEEVERAAEIYRTRIERANETLERVYGQIITQYENRGEHETAERLRLELAREMSKAMKPVRMNPSFEDDDDGQADDEQDSEDDPANDEGEANEVEESFTALIEAMGPVLVNAAGQRAPSERIKQLDYVVLYYTASWCRPCRVFTPKLIDFYNRNRRHGNWEIIIVSGDRSEDAFWNYLQSADMPWAAVPFHRKDSMHELYRGGYPRVHVIDREGNMRVRSALARDDGEQRLFNDILELIRR